MLHAETDSATVTQINGITAVATTAEVGVQNLAGTAQITLANLLADAGAGVAAAVRANAPTSEDNAHGDAHSIIATVLQPGVSSIEAVVRTAVTPQPPRAEGSGASRFAGDDHSTGQMLMPQALQSAAPCDTYTAPVQPVARQEPPSYFDEKHSASAQYSIVLPSELPVVNALAPMLLPMRTNPGIAPRPDGASPRNWPSSPR